MIRFTRSAAWCLGAIFCLTASGCAKKAPPVVPEPPVALEVPVPPPRILAPLPPAEPPAVQTEAPADPPPATRPRTPARASGTERSPAGKPETPTENAAPTVEAPRAAGEVVAPTPALRTPQTANDTEAERRVRDVLGRALRGLEGINRAALSADARAQFDTARRFVDQATDALKARNYMFAGYLADKAEQLARGLAGR
ncbi:MAG: hypothetical protein AB7I50_16475 [Vicinamibacterales bacterium]